jgi:hypothetical protein
MDLHEYIKTHGTTITAFAKQIDVSRITIHSYMGGAKRKQPSLKTLQKIHEITGGLVGAEDFFVDAPNPDKKQVSSDASAYVPKRDNKRKPNNHEVFR